MMIKWVEYIDNWANVKRSARTTISKDGSGSYPTTGWKKTILLAEHSPIRRIRFSWRWENLKSWVSVHFVRHKFGIEHWVSTQRSDRTGVNRDKSSQDTPVQHECEANAQALIFISVGVFAVRLLLRPGRPGRKSKRGSRRLIRCSAL